MTPADWAAFVLACLSIAAILIGGLRYIIRHEVPAMLQASDIVQRIEKLESMFLEYITNERKKAIKKRTR
ncbi:MAG: hypothetical protein ACO24H_11135 [Polynucleobacter sp.]